MKITKIAAMAVLTTGIASVSAHEDVKSAFQEMLDDGKVSINARLRYEGVEVGSGENLDTLSLRTRLGFTSAAVHGFQFMAEAEDVTSLSQDKTQGLDPETTEINQLWASYTSDAYSAKLGRQVYTLDDHRFIGHVGWRQNIQSFDAITTSFGLGESVDVKVAYIDGVNRINAVTWTSETVTVNATAKISDALSLTGFGYLIKLPNITGPLDSSDTYGVRATGKFALGEQAFTYAGSFATQTDNDDSKTAGADYDNDYYDLQLGTKVGGLGLGIGYEVLGGNGTKGFATPFATVHKFNGFADVFAGGSLGGLSNGLKDMYATASYKLPIGKGIALSAAYHQFETDENSTDLGSEIDLVAAYPISKSLKFVTKYANYSSDTSGVAYGNADKKVITAEINFVY